jgi:succinate-semialdehyde dehydrogenase/glutarate-semialdehyde dehydrogenase
LAAANNTEFVMGREGSHLGMDDYVEIKYLCMGDIPE